MEYAEAVSSEADVGGECYKLGKCGKQFLN
jgi:hypothetical protein